MSDSTRDQYARGHARASIDAAWQPRCAPSVQSVPRPLKPWLDEPGSLTRRLRGLCGGGFNVRVAREGWRIPAVSESLSLGLRLSATGWVREVLLRCDGQPLVFARTVMPAAILRGHYRALRHLGRRPLGSLLFGRDTIRRGPLTVARLEPPHRLHDRARALTGVDDAVWARRSVFHVGTKPILVTEVFLPELVSRLQQEGAH
ncbi:chorismate lyase [Ectothiorhodospiraceae bacterium WFHF3C12]|nr:chorismate lyase [Ectothiorhodospiraceae bacterium WFHF3C12]